MKQLFILLNFLFFTIHGLAQEEYNYHKKITPDKLKFDIKILKDVLEKNHPGLFWYQSKSEFDAYYQSIIDSLTEGKTEYDFYKIMNPFVTNVNCGHTYTWLNWDCYNHIMDNFTFMPLEVKIIDRDIYVFKNMSENDAMVSGSKILSINNQPADEILEKLKRQHSSDGFIETSKIQTIQKNFSLYYTIHIEHPSLYSIRYITPMNDTIISNIKGVSQEKMAITDPIEKDFTLKKVDSLNTAILTIKTFGNASLKKFLKESFTDIYNNEIENLIIDIRDNGGGNDNLGSLLYSWIARENFYYYDRLEAIIHDKKDSIYKYTGYPAEFLICHGLKLIKKDSNGTFYAKNIVHNNLRRKPFKPQKKAFSGNVYILINGWSFSVTSEFSSVAYSNNRAVFIGQETGGGYCGNTSGTSLELTLPNSQLLIYIPTIRYYSSVSDCDQHFGRGIIPHHIITPTMNQFMNGTDPEMEYAIDLISKEIE